MTCLSRFLAPRPTVGDVVYVPCLGNYIHVVEMSSTHVTLMVFGEPSRQVIKHWRLLWFRFRARNGRYICWSQPRARAVR